MFKFASAFYGAWIFAGPVQPGASEELRAPIVDALNRELRLFYETEAQALLDAELAPLAEIDAEERAAIRSYEEHAAAVAADLARLGDLQGRRHQVSVAVHRLTGEWVPIDSSVHRAPLGE